MKYRQKVSQNRRRRVRTWSDVHASVRRIRRNHAFDASLGFTFRFDVSRGDEWSKDVFCGDVHERAGMGQWCRRLRSHESLAHSQGCGSDRGRMEQYEQLC